MCNYSKGKYIKRLTRFGWFMTMIRGLWIAGLRILWRESWENVV